MIEFNHHEQAQPSDDIVCTNCGWFGTASQVRHLAGEPVCPKCKCSGALHILENGEEPEPTLWENGVTPNDHIEAD